MRLHPTPPSFKSDPRISGFTMVELLVVLAMGLFLLGLSAPLVSAARSEIAMQQTLKQVKAEIKTALSHALSGKSLAALSNSNPNSLLNPELLPAMHGLYLEAGQEEGSAAYAYVELGKKIGAGGKAYSQPLHVITKEWPNPSAFLKAIRLKNSATGEIASLQAAWIFFEPPFGKIHFAVPAFSQLKSPEAELPIQDMLEEHKELDEIELEFWNQDEAENATVIRFGKDKVIQVE